MTIWRIQSNMNRGELDPRLVGRIDIQAYYNGLREASQVLTIPQGGVKRRPGQDYLGTALGNGRLENFSFNIEQSYLLVFTDLRMQIYKDGVLQTNINGSGNDYVVTPWTLAQLQEFDFIQSADTAIVVHPDIEPRAISRSSDTDWDISTLPLVNIPQYNFNDASSPSPVSEIQDLLFVNANEGDRYKLALNGILSEDVVFGGDDSTNEEAIRDALQDLSNTANTGVSVSSPAANTYRVTFADNSADAWELVTGTATLVQSTSFEVNTTRIQTGTSGAEDVWSSTRGWPRTCVFHEGRLYFGGSKSRPATLWGSNVNDFFNFDEGKGRDDELINATLDTDQVNAINAIFSNRALQIFTSGAEFFVSESPITPSNVAVKPQTNLGSRRVRPVSIDGVTLFAQRTGKAVNQFVFLDEFQANQTSSISSLAPHLVNTPVKMATSQGTDITDANYVYILNDNGELTVFNTLASEDVQAFTRWTTGNIKSVAVVSDRLYTLVEREINSSTVYYVEIESLTAFADSAITSNVGGSDTLTGLSHLEGETVDVKADGAYQGQFTVSSGQVTITRDADVIEAGIPYTPVIRTMPLNVDLQNGPNAASKKKILRAAIQLFESNGVIVNDQRLADRTIGVDQFDAPTPQTGFKRITLLGWSLEADITITQDTPFDMTILSIGMEVKG